MKSFRDWDLSCRINAVLLIVMLAAGVTCGLYLRREANRFLEREITRTAEAAVTAAAERINRSFPVIEASAREMALSLELMHPSETVQMELLEKTLRSLHREIPALCGISIARIPGNNPRGTPPAMLYVYFDKAGEFQAARLNQSEHPWPDSDWFKVPQLLDRAIWTEPYRDAYTGILMCTWSQPIRNADGTFSGITGFDLSLEGLNAEVVRADAYGYGQEFLISRFGRFVSFPEDPGRTRQLRDEAAALSQSTIFSYADLLREKAFNPEDASALLRRLGRSMLAGESGRMRGQVFNREAGMERIFYAPLKSSGWSLGVAYPEVRLFAPLHDLAVRLVPAATLLLLVALLAAWIFVRRMTRPLRELTDAAQMIGEGNFNAPLPETRGQDQVGRLTDAFRGMQRALAAYIEEFKSSTETRERIGKELEIARRIQEGILPEVPASSRCGLSFFAELRPARRVGGNLYDFFRLDDDRCCFIIGDVAGDGVPAALQMAVIQTLQRGEAGKSADPGAIVGGINEFLCSRGKTNLPVSYLLGILDIRTGEVRYTNAGHPAPCVRRSGGALELLTAKHGPPVGSASGARYGSGTVRLEKGDTLLLYTDGVTGMLDPSGTAFGSDALLRVAAYRPEASPDELGAEILGALDRFSGGREQADDLALLILRFDGYEEKGASSDV